MRKLHATDHESAHSSRRELPESSVAVAPTNSRQKYLPIPVRKLHWKAAPIAPELSRYWDTESSV